MKTKTVFNYAFGITVFEMVVFVANLFSRVNTDCICLPTLGELLGLRILPVYTRFLSTCRRMSNLRLLSGKIETSSFHEVRSWVKHSERKHVASLELLRLANLTGKTVLSVIHYSLMFMWKVILQSPFCDSKLKVCPLGVWNCDGVRITTVIC